MLAVRLKKQLTGDILFSLDCLSLVKKASTFSQLKQK
jgi:hypothetical protein